MYQVRVLGPPEVVDPNGQAVALSLGKPLALLAYVACHGSTVSRDELAAFLWPEADRRKGRHSVRQALFVLKNALGEDLFGSLDPLTLPRETLGTDLEAFNEALAAGRVEEARALWRGPFLEHFVLAGVRGWNRWAEDVRAGLEKRFCKALLQYADSLAEAGEADQAISALDQAVSVAPYLHAPHLARIELLLDLLRLDLAREAIGDARQSLREHVDSLLQFDALETKLDQVVMEQRTRVGEGEDFPMEFVGRSRELAGLNGLWKDAILGRTRVAVITGPSGIGKTRLALELHSYVSGDQTGRVSVKGNRGETKLRWGAASELVRQLLRLPGSAGISSASDSLLRAMLPSMGRVEVSLQTVNGVSPAAILDAVTDLLEAVTFEVPLAVMVDDFQWMDPESRTLFVGLANHSRELRALLLYLGRSDLSSRHWEQVEETLVTEAGARRFLLEPLIEEEVGELLALAAAFDDPEAANAIVKRVYRASAGNPLFVREILRDLQDQDILRRGEHGWAFHTSGLPDEFAIPENIQTLLRERLQRLSEPAAHLAAFLARENRGVSSEALQKLVELPQNVFTHAVAELLERGVIEWTSGNALDFVHELLRDEAARTLRLPASWSDPRGSRKRPGRTWIMATLGVVGVSALSLGSLWGHGVLPWERIPDPPLFGGGSILFRREGLPFVQLRVTADPPEEWPREPLDPVAPSGARQVFRGPGGKLVWFGIVDEDGGPDLTMFRPDGTEVPVFPGPGDQTLYDLSPDASRVLFVSENLEPRDDLDPDFFSHSLFMGDLQSGATRRLYKGHGHVGPARWSLNGDLIAFIATSARDTLLVTSLQGERIGEAVLGDVTGLAWCGESILLASSLDGEGFLLRAQVPAMTLDTLARIDPGAKPVCSPDGTAVAFVGVADHRLVPLVQEVETGMIHRLSAVDGQFHSPAWLPQTSSPVPVSLQIQNDSIPLALGEEIDIEALVVLSDGTESSEGIRWESLNPAVASIGPYQELTGNGAGATEVVARWGYSLLDTVLVTVRDDGTQYAILRTDFAESDSALWTPVGSGPPEVARLDGETVLRIRGNEKYTDGLLFREPLSLARGITVEAEFMMHVTRPVHQNFGICLRDGDVARGNLDLGIFPFEKSACTLYPAQEMEKLDPSEISISTFPGRILNVRVPEALPSDGWVHLALQVRADGQTSLVVNRQRVAVAPVALDTRPSHQWVLLIQGDAIGTEIFVRNLAVWAGERY